MGQQRQTHTFRFELRRKALHILVGLVLILLIWFVNDAVQKLVLFLLLLIGIALSVVEQRQRIPIISRFLDLFEHADDRSAHPGKGPIMFVAGALLLSLFFNDILAVTGLIVIAIGDPLAHLIGKKYGRVRVPHDRTKHVEGRVVAFLVCWGIAALFWSKTLFMGGIMIPWWVLPIGIAAGILIESLPLRKIGLDDNLLAPFGTAFVIYLLL